MFLKAKWPIEDIIFFLLTALFFSVLAYIGIKKALFLPFAFMIPIGLCIVYLAIFKIDKLILFGVFITPLSLSLRDIGLSRGFDINLSLPTEPIFLLVTILVGVSYFYKDNFGKAFFKHPITILLIIQVLWIGVTTITSSLPIVSLKFLISKIWFLGFAYFGAYLLFEEKENRVKYMMAYVLGISIVGIITFKNHAARGFSEIAADWVVTPFYSDHTPYGAALALVIIYPIAFMFSNKYNVIVRLLLFCISVLLFTEIILSYTRAAWVSIVGGILVCIPMLLGIKFKQALAVFALLVAFTIFYQTQLVIGLEGNKQDSKDGIVNNINSMTNISTDESNLERLNRWDCAIKMFKEKPILGWGPGTYMFQYAPFQKSSNKTSISTNAGTGGNAHSEFLGPLAEQGVFGLVIVVILMLSFAATAFKVFQSPTLISENKLLVFCVMFSVIGYFVHGILNNFLDQDKLSIPFFGMLALLVRIANETPSSLETKN